jgi:hypothetical protein
METGAKTSRLLIGSEWRETGRTNGGESCRAIRLVAVATRDIGRAIEAFEQLEVGGVLINNVPTFRADNMSYGGLKDSGFGREGVRFAMEQMSELKSLILNIS